MNIWLTSDLHFMHDKPFLYEPRGFTSITEMNEAIVERWNSVVQPNDLIYNLGDIALNDVDRAIHYIRLLNGFQHLIKGNHLRLRTNLKKKLENVERRYKSLSNVFLTKRRLSIRKPK